MFNKYGLLLLLVSCLLYGSPSLAQTNKPLAFHEHRIELIEDAGDISLTIDRRSALATPLRVLCAKLRGTARAWFDYSPATDTVTIKQGDNSASLTVHILDNYDVDSTRNFYITLAAESDGYSVRDTMEIVIHDNDMGSSTFEVDSTSIDFGNVNIGIMGTKNVNVHNTGTHDSRLGLSLVPSGREWGFQVAWQPTIMILGPDVSSNVVLGFMPPPGTAGKDLHGVIQLRSTAGSASVKVSGHSIDTIPPTIAFTRTRFPDTLYAGSVDTIGIDVKDNDLVVDAVAEYKSDNGAQHGVITHETSAMKDIVWAIPADFHCERCQVEVKARDRVGNIASGASAVFVVKQKRN